MIKEIRLTTANELRRFMHMAWNCEDDVGVHTEDNKIADAKSVLGLMALDYDRPVKVVTENEAFLKEIEKAFPQE